MQRGRGGRGGRGGFGRGGRQVGAAMLRNKIVSTMQTNSTRRLQKDMKELQDADVPLVGVSAKPLDNNMFVWHANIKGPDTSAYYGGVFHFEITFPQNYPVSPPSIRLFTDLPHPCVSHRQIVLDMLSPKRKESGWYDGWSSAYTVESILIQLQSFLFETPRWKRDGVFDQNQGVGAREQISDTSSGYNLAMQQMQMKSAQAAQLMAASQDDRSKYEKAVISANEFRCEECGHQGPGTPKPAFNERDQDEASFIVMRDPKTMLADELLCYHSRNRMPEVSLGIGVSMSRLPRTGEIRSVTPTLDLLSLRAFTKQKVRKSLENERFTHWLPLYFGEKEPYEKTVQKQIGADEEIKLETLTIKPRERLVKLLQHSLCFIAKGSTTKELTSEMVLEIMPKLIITHMVDMANERKHISILAIRRLINFIRLFRMCIELVPDVQTAINDKLRMFKEEESKRVKDFTPSLGDVLAISIVSDEFSLTDILEGYLEEQLDRQAFWILRVIPELDHTDVKYKNKQMMMEEAREEVCFKTGIAGFQITMLFFTLTKMLKDKYGRDFGAFEAGVDDNWGCLPLETEDELQRSMKKIQKIDTFQKYYQWIGVPCPDSEALHQRLHRAITNSKNKKYHGGYDHMNELPDLNDQIKEHLLSEPSPFVNYDEGTNKFVDAANPVWKDHCMKKFDWVRRTVEQGVNSSDREPAALAMHSDKNEIFGVQTHSLQETLDYKMTPGYTLKEIEGDKIYEDYPASFNWRDLYHKLCFESMLTSFDKFLDFKLFYEYINKLGSSIEVLRVRTLNKTKLKSNHYWIMVLMTKMTKLRVLKLHGNQACYVGPDFFKFLLKGMNYIQKEGRQLQKISMNKLLGSYANPGDNLFPCLKPHQNLISLDFSGQELRLDDAKALGKVLADFRQVRELNLESAGLGTETTKEIADGLMRAKQLEILKLKNNPGMASKVSAIIYNLAFSPKIRHIDISEMNSSNADTAEAVMKLIKISGAIEVLNLRNTKIEAYLSPDLCKALGENKTLKYLNIDANSCVGTSTIIANFAKAIAMNSYRNGALEAVSLVNWFSTNLRLMQFINEMMISDHQHEEWYGDKKIAKEMEKEQLVKNLHCKLKYLNIESSKIGGFGINYKLIQKQTKQDWPRILELATKTPLVLNMNKAQMISKDMETIAFMLADNHYGDSKVTHLSLAQNKSIKGDGAKFLATALKANQSLVSLNLSSCKLGVSGMVSICSSLATNSTIQSLSLYRNVFDVDGARALGNALKTNSSLRFLDLGHNRIRQTGLKSITEGILANPNSKVSEMSIKWNFITDQAFSAFFEQLILPKAGRTQQLKKVWIKNNFMSEYHKVELNKKLNSANLTGQIYVDDFEGVNLLSKDFIDRSIWIAPMPASTLKDTVNTAHFFQERYKCGFVVDVRMGKGRTIPGRTRENVYCIVEYAHVNSVPRSLKLASKKLAKFNGQPVRIYKAGTKTAVNMPSQRRRGF